MRGSPTPAGRTVEPVEALSLTAAESRQIVDTVYDAFVACDDDGRIVAWNGAAEVMFGYSQREAIGRDVADLTVPEPDRAAHRAAVRGMVGSGAPHVLGQTVEMDALRRSGELFPAQVSHWWLDTHHGRIFYSFVRDVSVHKTRERELRQRRAREAELTHRTLHDDLTGLANRALLIDHLTQAVARRNRYGGDLAVLFVDLDRFKLVNDSLGHNAGDALLRTAADRIKGAVRAADVVARVAGDEFVVICDKLAHTGEAHAIAERIVGALAVPVDLSGERVRVQGSVGVAFAASAADTAEGLLRDADAAMYRAKELGRGQIAVFDDSMRERLLNRLHMARELEECVERRELVMHYRPVVRLADSQLTGVHGLVCWRNPRLGPMYPDRFLSIADDTGSVVPISDWAVRQVSVDLRRWQRQGHAGLIALGNFSSRYLTRPGLAATLDGMFREAGLDPASVEVGIFPPREVPDTFDATLRVLHDLKDVGVRLAISRFGMGGASVELMRAVEFDGIRIGEQYAAGIDTHPRTQGVVRAVAALGRELGAEVLIDGVGTAAERDCVAALGCTLGQGDFFAPLGPADRAAAWL